MKFKSILFFTFVIVSSFTIGQTNQKAVTEVFEYISAEYDMVSEDTRIDFKNSSGEMIQFIYGKQDQFRNEEILFNKHGDLAIPTGKIVTKNELVGKKFSLTYSRIGSGDIANSKCCFKILSVAQADGLIPSK